MGRCRSVSLPQSQLWPAAGLSVREDKGEQTLRLDQKQTANKLKVWVLLTDEVINTLITYDCRS